MAPASRFPAATPTARRSPTNFTRPPGADRRPARCSAASPPRSAPSSFFSSYWKPHAPFEVPEPWASMYDEVEFPLPDFVDLAYVQSLPLPVQKMILRGGARPFETSAEDVQWKYRSYFAACSQIDREVGATLDVLDELGLRDSTLVIFCSDHGDQMLEHGLYGKNVFFEGSVRVPLMLAHPSIRPGPCDDLVESTDVLPTVIELCGLERPSCFQGRSLLGRIGSAPASAYEPRRYVFAENVLPEVMTTPKLDNAYAPGRGVDGIRHPDAKMVRSKRWKYCYYVGHGEELYDLEKDPGEMRNRANDPACAGVKRELKDALLDWLITADEPDQIAPRWREV
ncbi:MAG: sulfatase-like hydrolase/transferase [Planctomycetota bacterium]|nr:sulfatase-like hydrolase/transferase [Planctomycetota bacterium]